MVCEPVAEDSAPTSGRRAVVGPRCALSPLLRSGPPSCLNDRVQIGVFGLKFQEMHCQRRIGYEPRWVAGPSRSANNRNRAAGDLFDSSYDFSNRVSAASPEIEDQVFTAVLKPMEGCDVSAGQIANVDEIAFTGSIRGRIV